MGIFIVESFIARYFWWVSYISYLQFLLLFLCYTLLFSYIFLLIYISRILSSLIPIFLLCHTLISINQSTFRFSLIEAFESSALLPEHDATLYPIFRLVLQLCYDEGQYSILLLVLSASASTASVLCLYFCFR